MRLTGDSVADLLAPLDQKKEERRDSKVWSSGQSIGPYRVEGVLGRGGMGIVYRAVHSTLQRPVALKQIFLDGDFDLSDALARFRREAETLAALDHPSLVEVYEAGEVDGVPYLAMELVEGHPLDEILRKKLLPLRSLVQVLEQAAEGIAAAHARGIVHRDLKPANVIVDSRTGRPHVLDFGLAVAQAGREERLTRTGEIMGTAEYMAPEQIDPASDRAALVSPRLDVYALGIMLYEVLTGTVPFAGGTALEVLYRRTSQDPLPPHWLVPSVPRDLEAIALEALERQPEKRYSDAGEFAADLARWLAGEPVSARPPSAFKLAASWVRRNRRLVLASAVGLALAVAFGNAGVSSWRARRERDLERQANVRTATSSLARQIDFRLAEGQSACVTLARIVEMVPSAAPGEGASDEAIREFILRTLRTHPEVYGSCVAFEPDSFKKSERYWMPYYHRSASDPSGIAFLYPDYSAYDYHAMEWYRGPAETQDVYWTAAYYDENAGDALMVTCSAPFYADALRLHERGVPSLDDLEAHFRGVATVDVTLDHLHSEMNTVRIGEEGYAFLVERDGRVLTFPDRPLPFPAFGEVELRKRFGELYPGEDLAGLLEEAARGATGAVRPAACPYLGEPAYFTAVVLRGTAWRLVTVCPVDEAGSDTRELVGSAP